MSTGSVEHILIPEEGTAPNNNVLPLILYRSAAQFSNGEEPERVFENIFWGNNWGSSFRDGTFPFHHYHSAAHEVVGIARGTAVLQFGGPNGPIVNVEAGDAALIPAGVVHCRLDDEPGYSIVGAYPPGQLPDCCVLSEEDHVVASKHPDISDLVVKVITGNKLTEVKTLISETALPITDPIQGEKGFVTTVWD